MTRKHYIEIARILRAHRAPIGMVEEIARLCLADNPKFSLDKFMSAVYK